MNQQLLLPLHALTSTEERFLGSDKAFSLLKDLFMSASVLHSPDPTLQFIVEADASIKGVAALLSQCSPSDAKIHPCAFFSRCLFAYERNYDVGNRELLAVTLASEEWRHWLEGSLYLFIWTDHKNLEYLKTVKTFNPRQARWALFFQLL